MDWRLRGVTVGWCCVILMSTAGVEQVGTTGALPPPPERPAASVTQPDFRPPVRMEGARRASSTTVSPAGHRRAAGLEVAEPLLQAYRTAALVVPSDCHLPVSLLAAIGQVESGNLRGHRLDAGHRAVPRVRGPVLDGDPFGRVPDTDDGVLDGDRTWDRAVGPMQFLPATWIAYAVDLDGDGRLDPQDVEDAAGSAAVYLCQSGGDLAEPASVRKAVLTYNHSRAYLRLVLSWMAAYDEAGLTAGSGLATLPSVLLDSGAARVVTATTGSTADRTARVRTAASKHHGTAVGASGPVRTPTAKPGKPGGDPVPPGGHTWTPAPGDPPVPPGEELPGCETDPAATDPPLTDPPVTDAPVTDPSATEPPATDPTPAPTDPATDPAPDPTDPPLESCEPQDPVDPTTPVDPATVTDPDNPDEPQPDPCAPCAP